VDQRGQSVGGLFFGYSYFLRPDRLATYLTACHKRAARMSGETGKDVWWVKQQSTGGITPCVDHGNVGFSYQCDGKVLKIRAADGRILKASVAKPTTCISWNTLLVNDFNGYFVATYWYGATEWDGAIRVYDQNLKLAWEKTRLPTGKKATLTYADGKLLTGSGNQWNAHYQANKWKYIAAYAIDNRQVVWKCSLAKYDYL